MTLIIAEAGVNHNGDVKLAKELVDAASEAGADVEVWATLRDTASKEKLMAITAPTPMP